MLPGAPERTVGAPSSRHHPAVAVVASSGTGKSGQGAFAPKFHQVPRIGWKWLENVKDA